MAKMKAQSLAELVRPAQLVYFLKREAGMISQKQICENRPGKSGDETGINLRGKEEIIKVYLNRDEQRELKRR